MPPGPWWGQRRERQTWGGSRGWQHPGSHGRKGLGHLQDKSLLLSTLGREAAAGGRKHAVLPERPGEGPPEPQGQERGLCSEPGGRGRGFWLRESLQTHHPVSSGPWGGGGGRIAEGEPRPCRAGLHISPTQASGRAALHAPASCPPGRPGLRRPTGVSCSQGYEPWCGSEGLLRSCQLPASSSYHLGPAAADTDFRPPHTHTQAQSCMSHGGEKPPQENHLAR